MIKHIIKIGTNLLTTDSGQLDLNSLRSLVDQIGEELALGRRQIAIVTSGAITCGSVRLDFTPESIPDRQAAASVGQSLLMREYGSFFSDFGLSVGQILLSKDGLTDPKRWQHAKNTIETLWQHNAIPIINENDSVSTDEIDQNFSDNDQLSMLLSALLGADSLTLLSDIDGVYTANPKLDSTATLLSEIDTVDDGILALADDSERGRGSGGMTSKLLAAKGASEAGIDVVIANGRDEMVLKKIFNGETIGTHILRKKG